MSEPRPRVRAFGTVGADLDLDLDAEDTASVVTAVLAACVRDGDDGALPADAWWRRTLGARIAALLGVLEATDGRDLEVVLTCSGCAERIEVPLPVRALLEHQAAAPSEPAIELGGRSIRLRLPTGEDLRRWSDAARRGEPADGAVLARALVVGADVELDGAALAAVERALAEADPLVDFRVVTSCPVCGAPNEAEADLQALACRRLRRAQATLLDEIHRLAFAYHWKEADLIAMSAARRGQYLARLDRLGL